jgi:hypothetical protein
MKKLDKIASNLSEKKIFMEMLQEEELLGGSKGNENEVFLTLFTKIDFLNINRKHVLNTQFHIFKIFCRE